MYHVIFESNDLDSEPREKVRTLQFVLLTQNSIVRCAIEFDCQKTLWTEEIQDERSNAVLPSKSFSEELSPLEVSPQKGFGSCRPVSKFSSASFKRWDVYPVAIDPRHCVL